jgi:hypothetical protein
MYEISGSGFIFFFIQKVKTEKIVMLDVSTMAGMRMSGCSFLFLFAP